MGATIKELEKAVKHTNGEQLRVLTGMLEDVSRRRDENARAALIGILSCEAVTTVSRDLAKIHVARAYEYADDMEEARNG